MSKKLLLFLFACLLALPATAQVVINEIYYNTAPAPDGDANGDGSTSTTQDEFVEILNLTMAPVDVSGWELSDEVGVRHTFPANTTLPAGCGIVVFGGGTPTGTFGNMEVQTAGSLGLNDGGDTVTLNNGTTDVASETYDGSVSDESITRDPDATGAFEAHSGADGSGGALFSPGTQISGASFPGCGSSGPAPIVDADIFINEIDYRGSDPGDTFLELVVGPTDEDLSLYFVVLYRADGTVALFPDNTTPIILPVSLFTAGTSVGDFDFYVFFGSVDADLNLFSNPGDGLAICKDDVGGDGIPESLVSNGEDNPTIQFLSQAGTTTAVEGCAAGATSLDFGVEHPAGSPDGTSIGLFTNTDAGDPETGSEFDNFTPVSFSRSNPPSSTPGQQNIFQFFDENAEVACPAPFNISDFNAAGTTTEFVEIQTNANESLSGLHFVHYDGRTLNILSSFPYTGSADGAGTYTIGDAGAAPDQTESGFDLLNRRGGLVVATRAGVVGQQISTIDFREEMCAVVGYHSTGNVAFAVGTPPPGVEKWSGLAWDGEFLVTEAVPDAYTLSANYPNPFNPRTQIRFALPEASDVTLVVFDMLGREVAVLAKGVHEAGSHEVTFDAENLPSGVYIYRLQAGEFTETHRMLLLK